MAMAENINTVPDCLRFFLMRQNSSECMNTQTAENTLLHGSTQPQGLVEAMLFLLAGNYEDSGSIALSAASGDSYYFAVIQQDGLYYAFDPIQTGKDAWLLLPGAKYAAADTQTLGNTLMKDCDYAAFNNCKYTESSWNEWMRDKNFRHREYTDAEIQQLVGAGLTLEEAAEKLHTVEDAAVFLNVSGFRVDYSYNQCAFIGGYDWSWVLPADFVYEHMAGTCGGSSNLMNRLLAGDYAEQGYVEYLGSHIFNYFKQDGYYYFCDFINSRYLDSQCDLDYLMYVCKDPCDFVDYYCTNVFPDWDTPGSGEYLVHMYLYPRDGKNALAIGMSGAYNYLIGGQTCDMISSEVKDTLIMLYEREGYTFKFVEFDSDANRPPVVNIPTDSQFDYRTGETLD